MVKTNGFTLIEFMVVMAIVSIVIVIVIAPECGSNSDSIVGTDNLNNTMLINGIEHTCDEFGDCTETK